jgi:hypothetical protein
MPDAVNEEASCSFLKERTKELYFPSFVVHGRCLARKTEKNFLLPFLQEKKPPAFQNSIEAPHTLSCPDWDVSGHGEASKIEARVCIFHGLRVPAVGCFWQRTERAEQWETPRAFGPCHENDRRAKSGS